MASLNSTELLSRRLKEVTDAIAAINISGATGTVGPAGPTGPAGPAGSQILTGTGVPSVGLAVDGDYYIDTSANPPNLYGPKAAGVWPAPTALGLTPATLAKTFVLLDPKLNDDVSFFFTDRAITIQKIVAVRAGGTDIDWIMYHDTTAHGTTNTIVTRTSTASGAGDTITTFTDATIPADSFITFIQGTTDGTPTEISITVIYSED